jgi:hypothetical protein
MQYTIAEELEQCEDELNKEERYGGRRRSPCWLQVSPFLLFFFASPLYFFFSLLFFFFVNLTFYPLTGFAFFLSFFCSLLFCCWCCC